MIIFNGPSEIDGKPIVAIITGVNKSSKNSKTGAMPQVWILRSDIHPTEALKTGEDSSICGDCPHRPKVLGENALKKASRSCYVNTMAFNSIYKTFLNGKYETANLENLAIELTGAKVRIGAYGDPAAVPIEVWDTILKNCESTGYTHQWKTCNLDYANYCMASCDTPIDVLNATSKGYRTFFVQNIGTFDDAIKQVENIKLAWCPASKEKGKSTTCFNCMACSGIRSGRQSNIAIVLH